MDPISTPSTGPGSSPDPDLKDLAIKDRAHVTKEGRDALRTQEVRTTMEIAARQSNKPLDQAYMDLLTASVEPQADGSYLYLHGSVESVGVEFRKAKEQAALSIQDAKERTGAEMNALFDSLRSTKQTLEDAKNSGIDTKTLQQKIESVLTNEAVLRKFREQIDDVVFRLLEASQAGKNRGEFLKTISGIPLLDSSILAIVTAFVPSVSHYLTSIDKTFVDALTTALIEGLKNIFVAAFGNIQAEVATTLPKVTTAMTQAGLDQKNITGILGRARRDFNYKFGGTDAETILGFATVSDTVDLTILEKELSALGWKDPADADDRIRELRTSLFAGDPGTRFVLTPAEKAQLLAFINAKITPNPGGTSLSLMQSRVEQFGLLREWVKELINKHEESGKFDVEKVIDEIRPKFSSFDFSPRALLAEVDPTLVDNPTLLTTEQIEELAKVIAVHMQEKLMTDAEALAAIRSIKPTMSIFGLNSKFPLSEAVTVEDVKRLGITIDAPDLLHLPLTSAQELALAMLFREKRVEKITGKDSVAVPYRELIKEYAADGAMLFGSAFGVWKNWITSLPENVLSTPQDAEILRLYNQKKDLEKILSALAPIGVMNKATNAVDPGSLITGVGTTLNRSIKDMQAALDRSAKAGLPTRPARTTDEALAHAAELQEVGRFVLKELRERTCYEKINDPIVRNRAYLLALYFGIEHAKEYIRNPASYELSNPDNIDTIRKPEARVLAEKEAAGGLLAPLEKLGLSLDPRAEFIMADTWIPGTLNTITLDCPPGDALKRILRCHTKEGADTIDRLIRVYITRKDEGDITVERANIIVNGIREFLTLQDDDLQLNLDTKSEKRFDPITAINSGYEALKGMIVDGTYAEKALAFALIGGTIYAIRKAWPKHWKLIMTGPMLLAASMALKRATGKSGADYLNLHFMSEKHRKGSREQFARRSRLESEFSEVETPAGRAALDTLTDPNNPVPIEQLLLWRKTMEGAGPTLYSNNAPHLPLSRITDEMGEQALGRMSYNERNNEALRLAFLSFRSLCVDVCRARGLGGATLREKEEAGADYIRRFYTSLKPDCCTKCPDPPPVVGLCGIPPNRCYTMFEILTLERPPESLQKPLETYTEMALSKAGMGVAFFGEKAGNIGTEIERRKFQLEQAAPEWMDWSKENILSGWDSFRNWSIVSATKSGAELKEDWGATWIFLRDTTTTFGISVKENASGVLEWTFDTGADSVEWGADKIIAVWDEMHAHQITGPMAEVLEQFFGFMIARTLKNKEAKELAKVDEMRDSLVTLIGRVANVPPTFSVNIEQWMRDMSIAEGVGPALKAKSGTTHHERLMRAELLKRELFSYLAAVRIGEINTNKDDANYKPGAHRLTIIDWPTISGTHFDVSSSLGSVQETYKYIRSHYTNDSILPLIGQGRTWPGNIADYGRQYPTTVPGYAARASTAISDWLLRTQSNEYTKHGFSAYVDPLKKEAKLLLSPDNYAHYEKYLDTLALNVLLETAIQGDSPEPADIALSVDRAKNYLINLHRLRGEASDPRKIHNEALTTETLLKEFSIPLVAGQPDDIKEVLGNINGKCMIAGVEAPGAAPGVGPAAAPTLALTAVDALISANSGTTFNPTELARAIPSADVGQLATIRTLFDGKLTALPAALTAATQDEFVAYLAGVSDANVTIVEDKMLPAFALASDLTKLSPLLALTDAESVKRTDHMYNRATDKILRNTVPRVVALNPAGLPANAGALPGEIVAIMNSARHPDIKDAASFLLEYIFTKGKWDTDISAYQTYLTTLSSSLPPAPTRGWVLTNAGVVDRFTAHAPYASGSLTREVIDRRLAYISGLDSYP